MKNRTGIKARENLRKLHALMVHRAQQLFDKYIDPLNLGEDFDY
jgi:hypothetical protein